MTEPLTRLLHEVGDDLAPPPPPAAAVLERGHHLRRRRTAILSAGVSLAVVAVLTATLLLPGAGGDRAVDPVTPSPPPSEPTFEGVTYAVGNAVYLDGGETAVEIDDRAVKSLYYTSVGVLVRHGNNSYSDGGGPQRFTLIRSDGTASPVSVETEENAHGVDPTQPYLVWTEPTDGGVEVVVHDVDTDTEVARVPVQGEFDWSPPPVALDGDTVYVGGRPGRDAALLAVDWRTGEVTESAVRSYFPEVAGGRAVGYDQRPEVVEAADGAPVHVAAGRDAQLALSPSGLFALETVSDDPDRPWLTSTRVVDLGSGDETDVPGQSAGWSTLGQVFTIDGDRLSVCSPATGECADREVDIPEPEAPEQTPCPQDGPCESVAVPVEPEIQYGGVLYES